MTEALTEARDRASVSPVPPCLVSPPSPAGALLVPLLSFLFQRRVRAFLARSLAASRSPHLGNRFSRSALLYRSRFRFIVPLQMQREANAILTREKRARLQAHDSVFDSLRPDCFNCWDDSARCFSKGRIRWFENYVASKILKRLINIRQFFSVYIRFEDNIEEARLNRRNGEQVTCRWKTCILAVVLDVMQIAGRDGCVF